MARLILTGFEDYHVVERISLTSIDRIHHVILCIHRDDL